MHTVCQQFRVIGEILCDFRGYIEAHDEGVILLRVDRLVKKFDSGFLLELEAVAHRVAGIDEQSDLQRQIGFRVEAANFLWRLIVVDDAEVSLLQIGDAATMLVGDGEHDIDLVRLGNNGGDGIVALSRRIGGLLILYRWRAAGGRRRRRWLRLRCGCRRGRGSA